MINFELSKNYLQLDKSDSVLSLLIDKAFQMKNNMKELNIDKFPFWEYIFCSRLCLLNYGLARIEFLFLFKHFQYYYKILAIYHY